MWFWRYPRGQIDRQTDTQTDVLITILRHCSRGRSNYFTKVSSVLEDESSHECDPVETVFDVAWKWLKELNMTYKQQAFSSMEHNTESFHNIQLHDQRRRHAADISSVQLTFAKQHCWDQCRSRRVKGLSGGCLTTACHCSEMITKWPSAGTCWQFKVARDSLKVTTLDRGRFTVVALRLT